MNDLQSQLRQMPKPPVRDVVTSVGAQAKAILYAGLGMLALAGGMQGVSHLVAARRHWESAAALMLGLSIAPLFLAALLALWVYVQGKKCRKLAAGEYYVHWLHADQQWATHCELTGRKVSNIVRNITLIGTCGSFLLALVTHLEGNAALGSVFRHYLVFIVVGTIAGYAIGAFCRYCGNLTHRLKQTRTAQSLIGPAGVYMTGQFWPLSTFGQQLNSILIAKNNPKDIEFDFHVQTKHGPVDMKVIVPVPEGEGEVAKALVEIIKSDHLKPADA
ncbi:MAG: hypothetical protein AAGD11_17520 [Planctomycetota bacterium]